MVYKIVLGLFLLGCVLAFYMAFIEPFKLRVTERQIKTSKWTYGQPLRIALLGDMHMIYPWMTARHLEKIIERTNALKPDIILLLGDYVGDHPFGIQLDAFDAIKPLNDLKARCGVYAVLGNHDMRKKDRHLSNWPKAMIESSIPVLNNQSVSASCDGTVFNIAGIEDWWYGQPDIAKSLEGIDTTKPTLFMTHNPDAFPEVPDYVALSVAGHTHGGQIRFPFIGSLAAVVPSRYGNRYAYGHIQEDGKDLFVTAGLGMTGLPLRFLNKPEIALITLSGE